MAKSQSLVHVLTIIDGETEELVRVIELEHFSAPEFHHQFDVDPKTDPQMLDRYSVGPDDAAFLEAQLERPITFNFTRFAYFIEAAEKH